MQANGGMDAWRAGLLQLLRLGGLTAMLAGLLQLLGGLTATVATVG
jgi:hypothetical protein